MQFLLLNVFVRCTISPQNFYRRNPPHRAFLRGRRALRGWEKEEGCLGRRQRWKLRERKGQDGDHMLQAAASSRAAACGQPDTVLCPTPCERREEALRRLGRQGWKCLVAPSRPPTLPSSLIPDVLGEAVAPCPPAALAGRLSESSPYRGEFSFQQNWVLLQQWVIPLQCQCQCFNF